MSRPAHLYYRRKHKSTYFVDKFVYVAAIAQPLMTIPQIYQITTTKNVAGLSLLTWIAYTVFGAILLVYDFKHHILPLILTQSLWVIADTLVVIGILVYHK
jgi:uncharacterized protein with PQ loop repeat